MVTRHIKRNEDPASPSYINHAARRRDHLYRRENAPLAPRRQRCLPAAEAADDYLRTPTYDLDRARRPVQIHSKSCLMAVENHLRDRHHHQFIIHADLLAYTFWHIQQESFLKQKPFWSTVFKEHVETLHGIVRLFIVRVAPFRRPLGIFSSATFIVSAKQNRGVAFPQSARSLFHVRVNILALRCYC